MNITRPFSSINFVFLSLFFKRNFDELFEKLGGKNTSLLFTITAELGNGFYVLLIYCVCAGFLQYIFSCAATICFEIDMYHKINMRWTKLCGGLLRDSQKC
jgi:hypothetical protein